MKTTATIVALIAAAGIAGCGGGGSPTVTAKPEAAPVDLTQVEAKVKRRWGGGVKCIELADRSGAKCEVTRRDSTGWKVGSFVLDVTYSPSGEYLISDPAA